MTTEPTSPLDLPFILFSFDLLFILSSLPKCNFKAFSNRMKQQSVTYNNKISTMNVKLHLLFRKVWIEQSYVSMKWSPEKILEASGFISVPPSLHRSWVVFYCVSIRHLHQTWNLWNNAANFSSSAGFCLLSSDFTSWKREQTCRKSKSSLKGWACCQIAT